MYQLLPLRTREGPDTEELWLIGIHSNGRRFDSFGWKKVDLLSRMDKDRPCLAFVLKDRPPC